MSSASAINSFNGPFKRAELKLLPQYAASDEFFSSGKWTGSKNHILSLNSSEGAQTTEPLYCIIVGTVTADKTYLAKHGNFSLRFNEDARKAKLQFTLARPEDPDFGPDFDKAVIAFKKLQDSVSVTGLQQFFLFENGLEGDTMRMNYGLFDPKGDSNDRERERETIAYCVDREYDTHWSNAKDANYSCIMPVYDTNDTPVNPSHFATKLVDAMCEVTFILKHYAISKHKKANGDWVEANDVFSAQVETVAVLRKPPVLARSPYKGRSPRRPGHRAQLPTRGEQINATRAFVPRVLHEPAITGPTASSSESRTEISPAIVASSSISLPDDISITGVATHTVKSNDVSTIPSITTVTTDAVAENIESSLVASNPIKSSADYDEETNRATKKRKLD